MDAVEARDLARRRRDADDRHAQRLAFRRQRLRDHADAEDADGLALQKLGRPALPLVLVLRAHEARQVAGQRQHRSERRLRHRRAMHAVQACHGDAGLERRLVGDAVETGAERLHPFQIARRREVELQVLHHLPEGDQHVGVGERGDRLVRRGRDLDRDFGKCPAQPGAILLGDIGREREKNEQAGHGWFLDALSDKPRRCGRRGLFLAHLSRVRHAYFRRLAASWARLRSLYCFTSSGALMKPSSRVVLILDCSASRFGSMSGLR